MRRDAARASNSSLPLRDRERHLVTEPLVASYGTLKLDVLASPQESRTVIVTEQVPVGLLR